MKLYRSFVRIIWNCQMLSQILINCETVHRLKNHGATTDSKERRKWDISCYWWVCCIKIALDRKFAKSMAVKKVYWWVELQTFHIIMALQRPETSVLGKAIKR